MRQKQTRRLCKKAKEGKGFLAEVCKAWETEALPIKDMTRLCLVRIGLVLGKEGGALPELLRIYKLGLGGVLGSGDQWLNWIHIKDLTKFFLFATNHKSVEGLYNLVSPGNLQNRDSHQIFSKNTLSLSFMKVPSFALKLILGEKSALILDGPKVVSKRLHEEGFYFDFLSFSTAVDDLLSS